MRGVVHAQIHVLVLHETVAVVVNAEFLLYRIDALVFLHAAHQNEQVKRHLQRLAEQSVFRLDDDFAFHVFRDLANTAADTFHVEISLRFEIKVFVTQAEHAQIHVKRVHLGIWEHFLDLAGLLQCRGAAHFRAIGVAHLHVAGTNAVHETNLLRMIDALVLARPEEFLQFNAGHDVVIDAVAVFLFPLRFENVEARGKNHRLRIDGFIIAQNGMETVAVSLDIGDFGIQIGLYVFHVVEHLLHHVLGGMKCGEQPVPLCDMAAKSLAFFNNDRMQTHLMQLRGCFHSGGSTANNQYSLFHSVDFQTDLIHEGHIG